MPTDIRTIEEAEREINKLIDRLDDVIFIQALEAMESFAQTAREAREEELGKE